MKEAKQTGRMPFLHLIEYGMRPIPATVAGPGTVSEDLEGTEVAAGAGSAMDTPSIVGDFSSMLGWVGVNGGPPPQGLGRGAYIIGPLGGVISAQSLPVHPADLYLFDHSVRLIKAPRNGQAPIYVAGPMFMDASGKILSWGAIEPALTAPERHSCIQVVPPSGAVRVWLHLGGLWAPKDPQPDGLLAYSRASINVLRPFKSA